VKEYEKLAEDHHLNKECTCASEENHYSCAYRDPTHDYKAGFLKAREMANNMVCFTDEIDTDELKVMGEKEV